MLRDVTEVGVGLGELKAAECRRNLAHVLEVRAEVLAVGTGGWSNKSVLDEDRKTAAERTFFGVGRERGGCVANCRKLSPLNRQAAGRRHSPMVDVLKL